MLAYIADCSADDDRSRRFGFLHAANGLAFATPALSGMLERLGGRQVVIMAGGVCEWTGSSADPDVARIAVPRAAACGVCEVLTKTTLRSLRGVLA